VLQLRETKPDPRLELIVENALIARKTNRKYCSTTGLPGTKSERSTKFSAASHTEFSGTGHSFTWIRCSCSAAP
jgi:hypothetical protein